MQKGNHIPVRRRSAGMHKGNHIPVRRRSAGISPVLVEQVVALQDLLDVCVQLCHERRQLTNVFLKPKKSHQVVYAHAQHGFIANACAQFMSSCVGRKNTKFAIKNSTFGASQLRTFLSLIQTHIPTHPPTHTNICQCRADTASSACTVPHLEGDNALDVVAWRLQPFDRVVSALAQLTRTGKQTPNVTEFY
jgi:hypothetical protein